MAHDETSATTLSCSAPVTVLERGVAVHHVCGAVAAVRFIVERASTLYRCTAHSVVTRSALAQLVQQGNWHESPV